MTTRVIIAVLMILAFVAACGGSKTSGPSSSPPLQQSSSPVAFDITISGGNVNPTNAEIKAKVGQPIRLHVNSDAVDELHVHSVPDHTFRVEAKPNQIFQFTVDVPGQVEVELHTLDRTVATIQVQQ